ncbi:ferritin-like domain-containing protein [Ravibacter arvi]
MKNSEMKSTDRESQMKNNPLHKLFTDGLRDALWAEEHLHKSLSKMQAGATSKELSDVLETHRSETTGHVQKLKEVFESIGESPRAVKCEAMESLLQEATDLMDKYKEGSMVRDAALILGAQKIEHYEIASYGSLATFADLMGHKKAKSLLGEILEEEKAADEKLSRIAESFVNESALKE